MLEIVLQYLNGIPAELAVFVLSMMPVVELRGALPVALAVYDFPVWKAFALVIVGNMIPALLILYGWDWVIKFAKKYWSWLHKILSRLEVKTQGKWNDKIERYGPLALVLFVAIPFPFSGVWTGALAAWLFCLSKPRAILSILVGVALAAIGVGLLTYGGLKFF